MSVEIHMNLYVIMWQLMSEKMTLTVAQARMKECADQLWWSETVHKGIDVQFSSKNYESGVNDHVKLQR